MCCLWTLFVAAKEGRNCAKAKKAGIHHKQKCSVYQALQKVLRELAIPLHKKVR